MSYFLKLEQDIINLQRRMNSLRRGYKVYTALLSQSGTNDPVATVLQNTLGDIIWSRAGVGSYLATLNNAFPINKTVCFISSTSGVLTEIANDEDGEPSNRLYIRTLGQDSAIYLTSVEIRVYP